MAEEETLLLINHKRFLRIKQIWRILRIFAPKNQTDLKKNKYQIVMKKNYLLMLVAILTLCSAS